MPKCATTDYLEELACTVCNANFIPRRMDQEQCSTKCSKLAWNKQRDAARAEARKLKAHVVNIAYRHLNRDRYFSFDGKYEGPANKCITFTVGIKKDKGYHPMPRAVHCEPLPVKIVDSVTVHSEGTQQAIWTKPFPHTSTMPRTHKTYCAVCVEMVIDESERRVRVTKGVYLPIEHKCGCVRVYDLRGNLLETKQL